jgi:RimJ/RimL family protein N-acetyltransferase
MKLNIRPLEVSDYDNILVGWWNDWRWTAPTKDFLPENGTGGYIVYDKDIPICAGFMYTTNSTAVWCDWIISNIHYKDRQKRKDALSLLVETITNQAKALNKKYVYALIKNKPLINVYKKIGYEEASTYSIEMIKKL